MGSFLDLIFGVKPVVPTMPKLDIGTEQKAAIAGNQAALPGAEALVAKTNLFNIDQINKMLSQSIPGYGDITGNVSKNIASLTGGQIPQDVQDAVTRGAAGRALSGGYGGSQAGNNLVARDLGLTSLNLTQQGLSSAESWMKTMDSLYAPGMMNLSSMFISPMQQYQTDNEQNVQQFQNQWLRSQIQAMPDPAARGVHDTIMELATAYFGGSYGGSGTKGNTAQGGGLGGSMYSGAGYGGVSGGGGIDFGTSDWGGAGSNMDVGGSAEGVSVAG